MKKEKEKHLNIIEIEKKPKTSVFSVQSNHDGTELGTVFWYGPWRQYAFQPTIEGDTIWTDDCLDELTQFLKDLMEKRKNV